MFSNELSVWMITLLYTSVPISSLILFISFHDLQTGSRLYFWISCCPSKSVVLMCISIGQEIMKKDEYEKLIQMDGGRITVFVYRIHAVAVMCHDLNSIEVTDRGQ